MEYEEGIGKGVNKKDTKRFWHYLLDVKTYILSVLALGLFLVGYVSVYYGFVPGFAIGLLPIGLCFAILWLVNPKFAYYSFFVLNYFIMGISRYSMGSTFPFGVLIDVFFVYMAGILIIYRILYKDRIPWGNLRNGFTLLAFVWFLFSCFQLFNTEGMASAWISSIRGVAFYMFAVSFFAPLIINKYKDAKTLLLIWSVLTVLAVMKAFGQKMIGFDPAEFYWLFVEGGNVTHIISYGVRYFSFFTDAANFGASMAMSMTVFSICALFTRQRSLKIWFIIVSALSLYGMLISGTRAALAVPFIGYVVLVFLSKKIKLIITFSCVILFMFCFLNFTYIGNGNALIRRMRTAFDPNEPSMQTRYRNQAKLKVYMADKPLGVGLGLSGVKAQKYRPGAYVSTIPTDSWYVMIWVETGIIGLMLNLAIMLFFIGYGAYLVLFRIRSNLVKGIDIALLAGCSGMIVASYANEILGQFPNGIIIYTSLAIIFMSPNFDKELSETNLDEQH